MLAAAGLVAVLGAVPAEPAVPLEWRGSSRCDEGTRAAKVLAMLLDGSTPPPGQRAVVTVQPAQRAWVAVVEIETPAGTLVRTLPGAPCRLVADAVALIVAVAVDPLGAGAAVEPPLHPAPVQSPPLPATVDAPSSRVAAGSSEPVPARSSAPLPTRVGSKARPVAVGEGPPQPAGPELASRRSIPTLSAFVRGGGAIGGIPGPSGGWGGGLAVTWGPLRLTVEGSQTRSRTVAHSRFSGVGARVFGASGGLSVCWAPRSGALSMPICGGFEGGAFVAEGFGLAQTRTVAVPWVAAVPQVHPTVWVTSWLGLGVALAVPVALVRSGLRIDDVPDEFVRIEPVGVRVGPNVEVVFFDQQWRRRATDR